MTFDVVGLYHPLSLSKFINLQLFDPATRSCTSQLVQMHTSTRLSLSLTSLPQLVKNLVFLLSWFTALAVAFLNSTRTLTTFTQTENSTPLIFLDLLEALELNLVPVQKAAKMSLLSTLRGGGKALAWTSLFY